MERLNFIPFHQQNRWIGNRKQKYVVKLLKCIPEGIAVRRWQTLHHVNGLNFSFIDLLNALLFG